MYETVLMVHILGTGAIATSLLFAIADLFRKKEERYPIRAKHIGILFGFQLVSGSVLAALSTSFNLALFCQNIALYIAVVAAVEGALYVQMRPHTGHFPRGTLFAASVVGFASVVIVFISHLPFN